MSKAAFFQERARKEREREAEAAQRKLEEEEWEKGRFGHDAMYEFYLQMRESLITIDMETKGLTREQAERRNILSPKPKKNSDGTYTINDE